MKNILLKNAFINLRRGIYIILGNFDRLLNNKNRLVILCYHSIDNDGWRFSVPISEFKKQIRYMVRNYSPVSYKEVLDYLRNGSSFSGPVFLVTFDDGYKDIMIAEPILKKFGIKPILFALSDRENPQRESLDTMKKLLSDRQLKKLEKFGWSIESHGKTHKVLTGLSDKTAAIEIKNSKTELEKILNKKITAISYPHGKYSESIVSKVKSADYQIAFSMDDVMLENKQNMYSLPRVGVDGTHKFEEFKYIFSPSVISFRRLIKSTFIGRYI